MKNHTEDDLFRVLARPNIHEMVRLHRDWKGEYTYQFNSMTNIPFMKRYGWTWLEFLKARKEAGYPT